MTAPRRPGKLPAMNLTAKRTDGGVTFTLNGREHTITGEWQEDGFVPHDRATDLAETFVGEVARLRSMMPMEAVEFVIQAVEAEEPA